MTATRAAAAFPPLYVDLGPWNYHFFQYLPEKGFIESYGNQYIKVANVRPLR